MSRADDDHLLAFILPDRIYNAEGLHFSSTYYVAQHNYTLRSDIRQQQFLYSGYRYYK